MTGTALAPMQRRNIMFLRNLGSPVKEFEKSGDGDESSSYIIEGKPIFRSGKFSDSEGYEHEWDPLHINQMVDHAALLVSRKVFEDVPIRKGHRDWGGLFSGSPRNAMDELVGYMKNFRSEERVNPTDSQTYTYLLADLEIIEESAVKNVKSGLWRNMSAEISAYVTNSNAEYWPCIMGVAYVDIPAVEGLKTEHSKSNQFSMILEDNMTGIPGAPNNPNPPAPGTPAAPQQFSLFGKATTDYAAVQHHIQIIEAENTGLKQYQKESREAFRVEYVKGLVKDNKLPAPQEEGYIEYAKGLSDGDFENWKKLQDAASPLAITGAQGAGFSNSVNQTTDFDAAKDRLGVLKGIIANHSMSGMPRDAIVKLPSYTELMSLEPSFSLA